MSRLSRGLRIALAAAVLAVVELALRLASFKSLMRWIGRFHRLWPRALIAAGPRAEDLSSLLAAADLRLPLLKPSCLRQALALRLISAEAAALRIAVKRAGSQALAAHAWVGPAAQAPDGFHEIAAL